jgi:hypothetical protein
MKRAPFVPSVVSVPFVLVAAAVALSAPAGVAAQSAVDRALAAAPERARADASVVQWNADFTYETLKEGSGPLVCYDRSDEPGRAAFAVQCTSKANLERVAQNRRFQFEADGDREAVGALVAAAEADGSRIAPEYGSLWMSMNGSDQASARTHTTVAVPGATTASIGLPDNPRQGGAWIMDAGKTSAHIMTPGH